VVQVQTRLKRLFGALEAWKRGEEDAKGKQDAAGPSASDISSMAVDEAVNAKASADAERAGSRSGDKTVAMAPAGAGSADEKASNNGKRPLKKEKR